MSKLESELWVSDDARYKNAFKSLFPLNGQQKADELFYSIDLDGVHVITYSNAIFSSYWSSGFNSTDEFDLDRQIDGQLGWLKKDLIKANVNRHWVPWIVVMQPEKIDFQCHRSAECAQKLDNFQLR